MRRLLLLSFVLAACGDSSTGPTRGSLVVPVATGLPAGAEATVTVTGPGGFSREVVAPDSLGDLAAGAYTIVASSVVADEVRYGGAPATQVVEVTGGRRARAQAITYSVASAELTVRVLGLPGGAPASVTVTGPGGFSRTLTTTTLLRTLDPGTYTVAAGDVQAAARTWRPAEPATVITLVAGIDRVATVDYGAGTASLAITIDGVPADVDAGVSVTGPGGYLREVAATTTLRNLDPGTYSISPRTTYGSLASYAPTGSTQARTLADGGSATAQVGFTATPLALQLEPVVQSGLTAPVFATAPPGDARLFVVERRGRVRIVDAGGLRATPFLDIASRVNFIGERGMLGMAFDPQYATNGRFYVYYVALDGNVVLERFSSTPGADVASGGGGIVLVIAHGGSEHHGGMLAFGPDGMLYLAPGDGRCCGDPNNNAQHLGRLLGKLLRIDPGTAPYVVPSDNPFVGTNARPEIWALGLRSPWRFSFDAPTGMLYLADVGQDEREEVNVVPATSAALNYGWPIMEGNSCYRPSEGCATAGLTRPALDDPHSEGCSVTGGYVYRGAAMPELRGHYLYSDYCGGWLRSFRWSNGEATQRREWAGIDLPGTLSFAQDGAGELYMISAGSTPSGNGTIWRIVRR